MHPVLFSFGIIHIFSYSVFLILAWCVFSFLFWKQLRDNGVEDERIFDLTFYGTLVALLTSRLGFVLSHQEIFLATPLKIVSLWVAPGLSLYPGLAGGIITMFLLARSVKMRMVTVLDTLAFALSGGLAVGLIGSLLDGAEIGKQTSFAWGVNYLGHLGRRHPIQIYEIIGILFIALMLIYFRKLAKKRNWPYGIIGLWFFLFFSIVMFALEFLKESEIYWVGLTVNQWLLVALFAETLGAFYVKGGGRETARPLIRKIYAKFTNRFHR